MTDANQVVESSYDFSVVDSNSLLFLFKHAPEVAKELHISSELSFETAKLSHRETWMVWNFVDDVMSKLWLEVLTYACFCFWSVSLYFMSCRLFYFICFLQFVDSFIHHILVCHWAQVDNPLYICSCFNTLLFLLKKERRMVFYDFSKVDSRTTLLFTTWAVLAQYPHFLVWVVDVIMCWPWISYLC